MKTEIICITDRSGSMSSIKSDAEGGFNNFIADQRNAPGEARVTHVIFDGEVETLYQAKPVDEVDHFLLSPCGSTSLLDAIGSTLETQGKRIAEEAWADLVIVCVTTDGQENSSYNFSNARVKEMIEHAEKHGWKFVFLAANQDSFAVARSLGSSAVLAKNFDANSIGTQSAYAATSAMVSTLRAGGSVQQASLQADNILAKP